MRRVAYLFWVVVVSVLLIWLRPFIDKPASGVGETEEKRRRASLRGRIVRAVTSVFTWYEKWKTRRLYLEMDRFLDKYYDPILRRRHRKGFSKLGSKRPQTILAHVQAGKARFIREALLEGFSESEIVRGSHQFRVHEADEAIPGGGDHPRLDYPRSVEEAREYVKEFELPPDWVPPNPGDVSQQWRKGYIEHRPLAYRFLLEKGGKRFADAVMPLYDAFHVGMDRVSVLDRDCHYEETVEEAIREGVPADAFYREAIGAISSPRIRLAVEELMRKGVKQLNMDSASS